MRKSFIGLLCALVLLAAAPVHAALIDRVNEAFRSVYLRDPSSVEWGYWAQRVQRNEFTSFTTLKNAINASKNEMMGKVNGTTTVAAVSGFKTSRALYASSYNPNFLPEGTLIKTANSSEIYYIRGGKKSLVLRSIIDRWFGENHFYKHDLVTTVSASDLIRYPTAPAVNFLYIGKVLKHPDGTQFYIDDKLRKRKLRADVRTALKFPGTNLYPTTASHLQQFATGPAITRTDTQPGGMVIYHGPWHGGTIWRIEEAVDGKPTKRLFLSDYLYEAYGYPDEAQRVGVSATELARYTRGTNIDKYPDGWVVGLGSNTYVVQTGQLRLVASSALFNAMGYKSKYILRVFPEFLKRYPHGQPIGAFKSLIEPSAQLKATPGAVPLSSAHLIKVRPHIRELIAQINDLALPIYDRQLTAAENKFWVDYVYNGEVNNKTDLLARMTTAKKTGMLPSLTPRTTPIDLEKLRTYWFNYLFYFVHQKEPSDEDRSYWDGRIKAGDRDTIAKLGETLQWLKDTTGQTRR